MTKLQTKLFELAISNLHLVDSRQHQRHFSFIVKRNKILSFGVNKGFKTTPLAVRFGWRFDSIHSEVDAVKRFPYAPAELSGCKLYNLRINRSNELALARPCSGCLHFLSGFAWDKIMYSNSQGEFVTL
jgi:hypothetical protein